MRKSCEEAIYNTLSYSAVFSYPLSFHQLCTYLICSEKVKASVLKTELDKLVKQRKVRFGSNRYYLSYIKPTNWYERANNTKRLLAENNYVFKILGHIPWIKLIGITGTIAANSVSKFDDIDVFIVTQSERVWITRFFVVLLLKVLGKYRTDLVPEGKVCPNIFMDESNLVWNEKAQNLYVAHEILKMIPVVNKDDIYFKFMKNNKWVFKYLNRTYVYCGDYVPKKRRASLVDLLDSVLMKYQIWYMRKRKTNEVTSKDFIHFNRVDNTNRILDKYVEIKDNR